MIYNKRILLVVDHASNFIPKKYSNLGISSKAIKSHIAFDLGVKTLAENLSQRLKSSLILGQYSRLLIDNNRDINDPTLIPEISDKKIIPANVGITQKERLYRIQNMYYDYHRKIKKHVEKQKIRFIISLHSFNPVYKGRMRDIEIGILSNKDRRLSNLMIKALLTERVIVGDNKPYEGNLYGDTLYTHALSNNIYHTLIEIRNDLLSNKVMIEKQTKLLYKIICKSVRNLSY